MPEVLTVSVIGQESIATEGTGYFSPWAGANYPVPHSYSPFYSFSAETGYSGGDTSLSELSNAGYGGGGAGYDYFPSGSNITGSFADINGPFGLSGPNFPGSSSSDISGAAIAGGASGGFTAFAGTLLDMWYDFAIDKLDLPNQGARAFAGVINQESHGEPWALNPASGAVGADQWLGPRLVNMAWFIDNLGLPFESLGAQSLFLLDEFSRMAAGGGRWGRLLLDMYDPLNSQRHDASDFVLSFVRPGRGAETRNDINAGANFFPTGYSHPVRSSPLFGLVPLPDPEDY